MACHSCRACLQKVEPSEATSISSACSDCGVISDVLKEIAPVEIAQDDAFPKVICSGCLQRLRDFCEFRTLIVKSDKTLRGMQIRPIALNTKGLKRKLNLKLRKEQAKNIDSVNGEWYTEIKVEDHVLDDFKVERSEFSDLCLPDVDSTSADLPDTRPLQRGSCEAELPKGKMVVGVGRLAVNGEMGPVAKKNAKYKRPHTCNECGRRFASKKNLNLHVAFRHTWGPMPHICDVCGKGYPHGYMLKEHKVIHSDERNYKCPVEGCGKTFRFQGALWTHRRSHLGIKSYKCDICGKMLCNLNSLQTHLLIHKDEKPFMCEYCSRAFRNPGVLYKHLKTHKGPQPTQNCSICAKPYSKSYLKLHMNTHIDNEEKGIECEVCKKKFSAKGALNMHMKVHLDVKPYTCKICNKSFKQSGVLWKHQRVHTGETPFHCAHCPQQFGYKHHLKTHIQKKHQTPPE